MRSLLLLPLLFVMPLASGGRQPPVEDKNRVGENNRGLTPPARQDAFHHIKLNGHTFTLPAGFTIELAAKPPLADRPIVAAFDDRGRLYVCDSSGSNAPVKEQAKTKPHRIVRLEDTDGDGVFDKSTVFVPNVMFPEGAMWLNGSLYVSAPPQILKFTDTDDDGKADKEEVWHDGKTLGGCANDLHGPYAGPDGRIYWCKGGFEPQEFTLPGGRKITSKAAHIYRATPDGKNVEAVMTGGMDNPVDVVFTPGGERIFSTTFLQNPGNGKRDGLIHAVYGGVYGKDYAPAYDHPWTAPQFMPVMTHLGPAAPCGLHRYESDQFGKDYANNVFCCQFNLRKVSRHVLVPSGATFTTTDSDFVVSDQHDFHPTDAIEDADGSLLILDTGGWYKLCCPSSQLVKPDVTGAIYRVKKAGAHKVEDPWGLKEEDLDPKSPSSAALLLDDGRPAVRWKAVERLASLGQKVVKKLDDYPYAGGAMHPLGVLHALHALTRIDHPDARKVVRETYLDYRGDAAVRLAAIHSAGLWRDKDARPRLEKFVLDGLPPERRAAAEALGRIGDAKAIPAILEALADEKNDRVLDHSLTYGLIEINDPKETAKGLASPSPRVRRAVLAALDAMPGGNLDAKAVVAELDVKDIPLQETAWWIAGKHPTWGEHFARYFHEQLRIAEELTPAARNLLADRLAKFAGNPSVQRYMTEFIKTPPREVHRVVIRAMGRSGLRNPPEEWRSALSWLTRPGPDLVHEKLAALRGLPPDAQQYDWLRQGLGNQPEDVRLAVYGLAPPGVVFVDSDFIFVLPRLDRERAPAIRSAAANAVGRHQLTNDQLVAVAWVLPNVSPLDLPKVVPAFAWSTDEAVGLALVKALSDPKVRPAVRADAVKPILDKYPKAVRDEAEKLYALLAEARKDETAKLERLVKELPTGDVRRGQAVFNGSKAQCAACHKIGYVGGLVGPDLTKIGGIRTDRDLLESIVFPSASFVRSYEPVRVRTTDDRVFSGILKKDAADEIVLVIAADKEERIARADVAEVSPGTVSVMPAGLDQQLTVQELADLVAFLKACK